MPKLELFLKGFCEQLSLLPQHTAWLPNWKIHRPLTGSYTKVLQQSQPYNSVSADRQPADCLL